MGARPGSQTILKVCFVHVEFCLGTSYISNLSQGHQMNTEDFVQLTDIGPELEEFPENGNPTLFVQ